MITRAVAISFGALGAFRNLDPLPLYALKKLYWKSEVWRPINDGARGKCLSRHTLAAALMITIMHGEK